MDQSRQLGNAQNGRAELPSPLFPAEHRPRRNFFGHSHIPILTIERVGPNSTEIVELAAAMSPLPKSADLYPGRRRDIGERDRTAWAYVRNLVDEATSYIAGAFGVDRIRINQASFSMVTTPPGALKPVQRVPHFDTVRGDVLALLHYVTSTNGTGFFRHRESAFESANEANINQLVAHLGRAANTANAEYIYGSNEIFECIGRVNGIAGRLVVYPASALHSGLIPPGFDFATDPQFGRLTCNIFVQVD